MNPSRLGLGCWAFGGIEGRERDDKRSILLIHKALELGLNHLDTAQDYGNGHSEKVIGEALSLRKELRDTVFIATKAHQVPTSEEAEALVKRSLDRLKLDKVQLFYIHWPHSGMDLRPMMEGLEKARSKGKIDFIGVSNFSVEQMETASQAGKIDYHQLGYNLLWRFPEKEILPWCREQGVKTIAYSPIAQGLLSDRGCDLDRWSPEDPRRNTVYYRPEVWIWLKPLVQEMQNISLKAGCSLSELALGWVLQSPFMDGAVSGAGSLEQLESHKRTLDRIQEHPGALEKLQELSDEAWKKMPDEGNIFQYHP